MKVDGSIISSEGTECSAETGGNRKSAERISEGYHGPGFDMGRW